MDGCEAKEAIKDSDSYSDEESVIQLLDKNLPRRRSFLSSRKLSLSSNMKRLSQKNSFKASVDEPVSLQLNRETSLESGERSKASEKNMTHLLKVSIVFSSAGYTSFCISGCPHAPCSCSCVHHLLEPPPHI